MITIAGRLCRSSRRLLLALFGPGLHFTVFILVVLVLVHAGLAIASIYYGEGELAGRIHVGIMLAIGLGALTGIAGMARGIMGVVQTATITVVGRKCAVAASRPLVLPCQS
jgi:hypothetical protein